MTENWCIIKNIFPGDNDAFTAQVDVPESSPWFSGHFPGFPLLPGIAQLYMVFYAIKEQEKAKGIEIALAGIKKVRYRKMILPDNSIELFAQHDPVNPSLYKFTVTANGEMAAKGTIEVRKTDRGSL